MNLRNVSGTDVAVSTGCSAVPFVDAGSSGPTIPYTARPRPTVDCQFTQALFIPPGGERRTTATLAASYQQCAQSAVDVEPAMPLCAPAPDVLPPLPHGPYTIEVFVGDQPSPVRAVSPEQVTVTG
ncbi:hypothetical protein GB931_03500 [Modestobacter sp. I12A-02628]|uniref:Uncharacterized protein n=1 Tax=Goekera deserti TaxID=2497753 RepID=A0A7K3WCQ1_9ACTN|nr:hypothetical protein [Goekera deserti]MPQ97003.1 hypothetical protein [Goekera deserti]NDI46682.1 hypothetical protein [Goekera deserti]NEL54251.1 hypothetical protein [Goekera deserti]